jgi:PAS domain S-box-containing protein
MNIIKPIIKTNEQEISYRKFMLRYDTLSLQIACIIGSIYHLFFLIIDFSRVEQYNYVLLFRGLMTFILTVAALSINKIKLRLFPFYVICFFVSASTVLLSFPLDYFAGMPEYFLPNILCLLLYVLNTGIGYPLRMKSLFSALLLTSYIYYAVNISLHQNFHFSQSWNILINIIFSLLIGYLIERYKRFNFIQRTELQKTQSELKAILDSAFVSIIKTDKSGKITHFSKGAERMLGYKAEELIGIKTPIQIHILEEIESRSIELSNLFHKQINGFEVFVEFAKRGESETKEWTYVRKDGTTFPVQLVVSGIYNSNGEINGYLGIASDITELKKQSQIIQDQNIELENLNNTKDKFFSIVAHDLKSPLNSLKGFSGLLIDHYDRLSKEEIIGMSLKIKDSIDNTIKMADNLITWARIQMNDYQINKEIISVNEFIDNVCSLYLAIATEKGISIKSTLPKDLKIVADKNQFEFIIRNLINNSIKYTQKGGSIQIETKSTENNYAEIKISDNGIGISDSIKNQLFKVGKNRSSEGTSGEKGTGLGLMLVYEFVAMNNGEISFTSEVNNGTTFKLKFKAV